MVPEFGSSELADSPKTTRERKSLWEAILYSSKRSLVDGKRKKQLLRRFLAISVSRDGHVVVGKGKIFLSFK